MAQRKKDKWLNVFCPEDACLAEEEHFDAPEAKAEDSKTEDTEGKDQSTWLEVFCPESSCEIEEPSQLP
jgi:hypothetical protein